MPQGKGTYGSKVGRPPKKPARPNKPIKPKKKSPSASLMPSKGPSRRLPKKAAPKKPRLDLRPTPEGGWYDAKVGRLTKPKKAAPKKAAPKKRKLNPKLGPEVSLKPKPRNRSLPIAPKNQKARGRQAAVNAHEAVTKPKSAVKRLTHNKPVAPKNQRAKGRAVASKAPRPKRKKI